MTFVSARPEESPKNPQGGEYARLLREVKRSGLLDRRPAYYRARILLSAGMLVVGWLEFFLLGDSWWQLVLAGYLAFVYVQLAFLAHDAGHRQIFRTRLPNDCIGLVVANVVVGVSFGWWVAKHNRHHSRPNHIEFDPDINIAPIVFTAGQALGRRGAARFLARFQAYFFFPLLLLEAIHLHGASVRAVWRGSGGRLRSLEALLLAVHGAGHIVIVVSVLAAPRAIVFALVQQGLLGLYLGCCFAPNHKGMPVVESGAGIGYLHRQVLSSRNVRGGRFVTFLLGGLNYQIEHHLFPGMPRCNLSRARPIVRSFCEREGIAYTEENLVRTYLEILRCLHMAGEPVRGCSSSAATADLLHARTASQRNKHTMIVRRGRRNEKPMR